MPYILFSNVFISFDGKDVLADFNLNVSKGEKICFTAPSGKGKTTLLRMLLGFVSPEKGRVSVDGSNLEVETITDIRKKIAYLSQDVDFSDGTVNEVISEIINFHHNKLLGVSLEKVKEEAEGLELPSDIWSRPVGKLSGGERQRLGIALALSLKRELLLLDEPTSALDSKMKNRVRDRILQSQETVLIVSHDKIWKHASVRSVTW